MSQELNFIPNGDRVLVKPIKQTEEKSSGGIYIPSVVKETVTKATVCTVSESLSSEFKPGDVIFFPTGFGVEIKLNYDTYLILNDKDIYGKLN